VRRAELRGLLRAAQGARLGHAPFNGQACVGIAGVSSFLRDICGLQPPDRLSRLACAHEQIAASAWAWSAHSDFVLACGHPAQVHLDGFEPPRLHRLTGPALAWPDGFGTCRVHGTWVPRRIIEQPQTLTVRDIELQRNAEVRRALLQIYGFPRYITDAQCEVLDAVSGDHPVRGLAGARLLRKVLPGEPEPLVYLAMRNSTPEPDGTYREYLERIDPKVYDGEAGRSCHAAMASRWHHRDDQGALVRTFARWQDYQPAAES
jgi:hypothetical protein